MELSMRSKKKEPGFIKQQQGIIALFVALMLVLFTLGFKFQYVLFEIKSLITQKSFTENNGGVGVIGKVELLENEGMMIRDPQQSLFRNYIIEFNPVTVLENGDAVVRDDSLVGIVEQFNNQFAVVANISRNNYTIKGTIPTQEVITLNGRGDGDFLALVPRDYEVEVGDPVNWVRNQAYFLGDVVDIKFDARDVYKRVYVRSRVRSGLLQKVELLKEENPF